MFGFGDNATSTVIWREGARGYVEGRQCLLFSDDASN